MIDFDFINDDNFRIVLKRDYAEVELCMQSKAFKSVLVLTGSIVESVLLDHYCGTTSDPIEKEKVLKYDLYKLIELAHSGGILSQRAKDLSSVIRNYRNLIHPGREIRLAESVDEDSAQVAMSLMNIVLKEIREYILSKYGYTAKDIFEKLHSDIHARAIYKQLIQRVSVSERIKLLKRITDNEVTADGVSADIKNPNDLLEILKPFVPNEVILDQLKVLVELVGKGQSTAVIPMYDLYHKDLDLLPEKDRDFVIMYMLSYLKNSLSSNAFDFFYQNSTLIDLGKHIKTEDTIDLLLSFIRSFVINYKFSTDWFDAGVRVVEQILNGLDKEIRNKVEQVINGLPDSLKLNYLAAWEKKDDLPF